MVFNFFGNGATSSCHALMTFFDVRCLIGFLFVLCTSIVSSSDGNNRSRRSSFERATAGVWNTVPHSNMTHGKHCLLRSGTANMLFHFDNNDMPHYEGFTGVDCLLHDFRNHSRLSPSVQSTSKVQQIKVLTMGDSIDQYPCWQMFSSNWTNVTWRHRASTLIQVKDRAVYNCSNGQFPGIEMICMNIYGVIQHDRSGSQKLIRNEESEVFLRRLQQSLAALHYSPTHIAFGSFAWDLQAAYHTFCDRMGYRHNKWITLPPIPVNASVANDTIGGVYTNISCLCDAKLRRDRCFHSANEVFQGIAIPWCSAEVFSLWRTSYLRFIQLIHTLFPNTPIYIRTQPPSSYVAMGSMSCQNYMNRRIRHWVRSGAFPYLRLLDYDALLESRIHRAEDGMHYDPHFGTWNDLMLNTMFDQYMER